MFKLQIFKNKKLFKEYKIGDTLNKMNIVNAIEKGNNEISTESLFNIKDKNKLDSIEENANNYILPIADKDTLGGIKTGENITNNSGTISLTKDNVTSALGYTPPTTNTTYDTVTESKSGLMDPEDKKKLNGLENKIKETVDALVDSAPETMDTLKELADALGNDPNFATTVSNLIGQKLDKTETAVNAQKVNGLTVETAVPANAKFTDTVYTLTKDKIISALGYTPPTTNTTYSTATQSSNGLMSSSDKKKLDNISVDNKYIKIFNNKKWHDNTIVCDLSELNNIVYLHNGKYKVTVYDDGNKHHYARLYKINSNSETLINEVNIATDTNDNNYYCGFKLLKISENALWIFYYFIDGAGSDAFSAAEEKKTNWGNGNATYAFCPAGGYFWKAAYINTSGVLALSSQYTYIAADNGKYNADNNPSPAQHYSYFINDFWNLDSFVLLRNNHNYAKYTDPNKDYGLTWYTLSVTSNMQEYTINRDTGIITGVGDAVSLGTEYYDEYNSNGVYVNGSKNKTSCCYSMFNCYFYDIYISGSSIYIKRIKSKINSNKFETYNFPIIYRSDQTYANDANITPTTFNRYQYTLIGYNATLSAAAAPVALKIETGNVNTDVFNKLIIQDIIMDGNYYIGSYYNHELFAKKTINIIYINNRAYFVVINEDTTKIKNIYDKGETTTLTYRSDWYDYYFDLYTVDIPTKKIVYAGKVSEILERETPWAL